MVKQLVLVMIAGVANAAALQATSVRAEEPTRREQVSAPDHGRFDHSTWDSVLREHVNVRGLVDYAGIKESPLFHKYLASLEAASADKLVDDRDKLAFWIDAYNALTIQAVLKTLPADQSTWPAYRINEQEIRGKSIWKGIRFDVGGGRWTLDDIEHKILREQDGLRDPRIHVVLVCAARGCPPLWNRAYAGGEINDHLASAMTRFVSNPMQCIVDTKQREIRISKVFEWYGGDFVDAKFTPHAASIPKFLASYVTDDVKAKALLSAIPQ